MVGQKHKRTNNRTMFLALKNNTAAGYQGPMKIELLKGAGLLNVSSIPSSLNFFTLSFRDSLIAYHNYNGVLFIHSFVCM